MVNIGLLGDISVGKTSILRLFVKYLNKGDIEHVDGGKKCTIVKTDFSGEATLPGGDKENKLNEKETKTIHPNRVVFREDESNKAHTIFAPGGDRKPKINYNQLIINNNKKIIRIKMIKKEGGDDCW